MESTRCPGCMRQKTQRPLCEHCGYNETIDNLPHQLPIGTMLQDRYEIGKVLGQGGFGITYIGWDHKQQMSVAIKEYYPQRTVSRDTTRTHTVTVLSQDMQEVFDRSKARFLKEAHILARLNEIPEIVHIYSLFEENNTAYMVMEYLRGANLRQYIRMKGGRISLEKTLTVMRPIMRALQRVHDESLVHRDISPDNIMLLPGGAIKLLDFGAAREVLNADPNRNLSQSTEAILKHGFAPIEQYQSNGTLGPWTDVHALTGTIYYCLTGAIPPEAHKRLLDGAEVHWETVPGLTPGQIRALNKAMAVMPAERTRSVRELEEGLYAEALNRRQEELDFRVVSGDSGQKEDRVSEVDDWKFTSGGSIANKSGSTGNGTSTAAKPAPAKKKSSKGKALIAAVLAAAVLIGGAAVALTGSGEKTVDPVLQGEADRTILYDDGSRIQIFLNEEKQETGRLYRDADQKIVYQFTAEYDENGKVAEQKVYDAKGELLRTDKYTYNDEGILTRAESRSAKGELIWKGDSTFVDGKIAGFREETADGRVVTWAYDENGNIVHGIFFNENGNTVKNMYYTEFLAFRDVDRQGKVDYFAASQMAPRGGPAIRPFVSWGNGGGGGPWDDVGGYAPEKPKSPIAIAITEPEETWPEETEEPTETVEETEPLTEVDLWVNTYRKECNGNSGEIAHYETRYDDAGQALGEVCEDFFGNLLYDAEFTHSGEELITEIRTAADGTETVVQYVRDICGNLIRRSTRTGDGETEYEEYDPAEGIVR